MISGLCIPLLLVVHRGYYAHVNGIVLWKGILAGSFLAFIALTAAFRILRREQWIYWLLLATAVAILGVSSFHGAAEIIRAFAGERIEYIALTMTIGFAVLAFVISSNLFRREAREYFDGKRPAATAAR